MGARLTLEIGHHQASGGVPDEVRGCLSLWAEVLRIGFCDAAGDITNWPTNVGKIKGRIADDLREGARSWIASDDLQPTSFLWICGLLELEPSAVREALARRMGSPPP